MPSLLLLDAYIQSAQAEPPDRFAVVYNDAEDVLDDTERHALACAAERSRQHQTTVTVWRNDDARPIAFAFGGVLYMHVRPTTPTH